MSLKTSYRFIAPFYDVFLDRATRSARQHSLAKLPQQGVARVLLSGVGTGLDFPFLSPRHEYTALDLTGAMLAQAKKKAAGLRLQWVRGDSMALPFASDSFELCSTASNHGGGITTAILLGRNSARAQTRWSYSALR